MTKDNIDIVNSYKLFSLNELYELLFRMTREMCSAAEAKKHEVFLEKKQKLIIIRECISQLKTEQGDPK